ncbi:MAG: helix-turn-helix transcriptional regulator [Planctomycetes bacterium]|nr:helix-turn-helix transcriptional regulator [Planctomycetota bacterium]
MNNNFPAEVLDCEQHESFANALRLRLLAYRRLHASGTYLSHDLSAPFNRLYLIQQGHVTIRNKDQSWKVGPGKVVLIPLNRSFSCEYSAQLIKTYFHFRLECIPGRDLFAQSETCHHIGNWNHKETNGIFTKDTTHSALSYTQLKAQLLLWLSQYMDKHNIGQQQDTDVYHKYAAIFDIIENGQLQKISIQELAAAMHMSVSNFSRKFNKDTGLSPKAYINKRMIEEAQYLLLASSSAISDIAHQLDFDDEHYFSRFFKKHSGLSPKDYRKTHSSLR